VLAATMKDLRILVIDTDLFSLSKLFFTLLHLAPAVEACNALAEVPERIGRFEPDLVVLGSNMGAESLSHLTTWLRQQGLPTLLVTNPTECTLASLPVDGFLPKPTDRDSLRQAIGALSIRS
jgi:DNA-binding response OmpR family regulator